VDASAGLTTAAAVAERCRGTVRRIAARIGVVSDTHIIPGRARALPPDLLARLTGVERILHAGDLVTLDVLEALRKVAPVTAVRGNVDYPEVRVELKAREVVEAGGALIGVVHGDGLTRTTLWRAQHAFGDPPADASGRPLAAVVFGHSHQPYCQRHGGVLFLNPGSPTDHRRAEWPSFAFLHVRDDGTVDAEHVWLRL
jgi:putative phosphoesterase